MLFTNYFQCFILLCSQDDRMASTRRQGGVGGGSSNVYDELRARKRRICHIIHNSTWIAEIGLVLICIVLGSLAVNVDDYFVLRLEINLLLFRIFTRIISPFSHLFNEERIKLIILTSNWTTAMRQVIQFNVVSGNIDDNTRGNASRVNGTSRNNIEVARRPTRKSPRLAYSNSTSDVTVTRIYSIQLREDGRGESFSRETRPAPIHNEAISLPNTVTSE